MGKQMIKRTLKAVVYLVIIVSAVFLLMRQVTDQCESGRIDAKPVIYLYPETETQVTVKMDYSGKLTCTYPAYDDGWQVTAAPDGTLTDAKGQTYNYLYWEGETATGYDLSEGFCVPGADTAAFLEDALARLGLNRKEANEFIVYWLPQMEDNPYNLITFQQEAYTEAAKLTVEPVTRWICPLLDQSASKSRMRSIWNNSCKKRRSPPSRG